MADLAEGNGRKRRIDRLLRPIRRFMEIEASSGLILVAATLLALGLANSPLALLIRIFSIQKSSWLSAASA